MGLGPSFGAAFAFRGKRGDRLKLLYFDGQGYCLFYKILERDAFLGRRRKMVLGI
ncbi:IS66 family insertion sequence element accessory protein TnpB [Rhizobium sp. RHZ02]|uniref:IS66 family insertion sequence element accessory protein TnpB n=1 Tax=Rhizobium sp. RHZ02 TaxID=2769306 RepID=UPI001AEE3346|nr:IS66 family insertion sequence element accessory protein TnpB [Rhizobium sp. RHZ02]